MMMMMMMKLKYLQMFRVRCDGWCQMKHILLINHSGDAPVQWPKKIPWRMPFNFLFIRQGSFLHHCTKLHNLEKSFTHDHYWISIFSFMGGGEGWLVQKPSWNWYLITVANFGEVRRAQVPHTHFIGGWVAPRANLETKVWRKISTFPTPGLSSP